MSRLRKMPKEKKYKVSVKLDKLTTKEIEARNLMIQSYIEECQEEFKREGRGV